MIVDADLCIKIGTSARYCFLENLFPNIADKIYIHQIVYNEIMEPVCAKDQIDKLIANGIMEIVEVNDGVRPHEQDP